MKVGQRLVIEEEPTHFHCLKPMTIAKIVEIVTIGDKEYVRACGPDQAGGMCNQLLKPEHYELIEEE